MYKNLDDNATGRNKISVSRIRQVVCKSIERLQCHPGKVHTYVDSLAAMFFGVLTINTSGFI